MFIFTWLIVLLVIATIQPIAVKHPLFMCLVIAYRDTGNLASIQGAFPPPYFNNRASNGWVGVEVMAGLLGAELTTSLHLVGPAQGNNYAVGGARAHSNNPIDLNAQIDAYLSHHHQANPAITSFLLEAMI